MDENGYPTTSELKKIEKWDVIKDPIGLIGYIKGLWWMPDWGFVYKTGRSRFDRKKVMKLELHTGGWSGNEDIIEALEKSHFWIFYWKKSVRGGHYYFEVRLNKK